MLVAGGSYQRVRLRTRRVDLGHAAVELDEMNDVIEVQRVEDLDPTQRVERVSITRVGPNALVSRVISDREVVQPGFESRAGRSRVEVVSVIRLRDASMVIEVLLEGNACRVISGGASVIVEIPVIIDLVVRLLDIQYDQ